MTVLISPASRARQIIANHRWTYGEDRLALRAVELTDQEIERLQDIAGYYSGTSDTPSGAGMLFAKAVALAAVEVMGREPRLLARSRRRPPDESPGSGVIPERLTQAASLRLRPLAEVSPEQRAVCERFGVEPFPSPGQLKVGIGPNVREGERPLKAIRHLPVGDTSGWYIWGGDIEASEQGGDFFDALHVAHLEEWAPEIVPYLALPPGYGVVVESGYEDVWFDASYVVE